MSISSQTNFTERRTIFYLSGQSDLRAQSEKWLEDYQDQYEIIEEAEDEGYQISICLLYTSPSPRDA